jgi:hypothetical protein
VSVPATSGEPLAGETGTRESSLPRTVGRVLPLTLLWLVAGTGLAAITTRVRDWYAMPNELLNEHRAISVAQTLSPLPVLHRQFVASFDQLYPLLIAPMFRGGDVLVDVRNAHALNAYLMTSACIPAYLLARRVTDSRLFAYLIAALSVCMPWIFFATLLMGEVAAYPVFLWALLAFQSALVEPSRRRDALALGAIALAFLARPQLGVLAIVLPIAVAAYEIGAAGGPTGRVLKGALAKHRLAGVVYAVGIVVGVGLLASGRLAGALGVYGSTVTGNLVPHGIPRSLAWHVACFSLGVGILPLVAGIAWLLARFFRPPGRPEQHAFACLGATVSVTVLIQVTVFDLRFIDGLVLDRYLIYLVPVVFLGFVCALRDARSHTLALGLVTFVVVAGFAFGAIPTQPLAGVNSDEPIQVLYPPIVSAAGSLGSARALLAGGTIVLVLIYLACRRLLSRHTFVLVFAIAPLAVIPYLSADVFSYFFHHKGWSERAVTSPSGASYSWIDQKVGPTADVTIVPYPTSSDYLVSERVWRDYEFWNKSVDRDVQLSPAPVYEFTNETFPKLHPAFDPKTGLSTVSGGPWVVEGDQETRARISGTVVAQTDVMLIHAAQPWRADWISSGLYDDGWTRPGKPVRIRVFAVPSATTAQLRGLTVGIRGPDDGQSRPVSLTSNHARWHGSATASTTWGAVSVCVPAHGYADVTLRTPAREVIPGDLRTWADSSGTRIGGLFLSQISLADEIGGSCRPG